MFQFMLVFPLIVLYSFFLFQSFRALTVAEAQT